MANKKYLIQELKLLGYGLAKTNATDKKFRPGTNWKTFQLNTAGSINHFPNLEEVHKYIEQVKTIRSWFE